MKLKLKFINKEEALGFINKYFVFLAFAIGILVVGIGVSQFLYPLWNEVQGVDIKRADQKQTELSQAKDFEAQLKIMRTKYQEIDYNDIRRLDVVLPKGLDKEKLFLTMQNFGKNSGFTVSTVTISTVDATTSTSETRRSSEVAQTETAVAQIRQVGISISVNGVTNYSDFKKLLQDIETHAPLLTLRTVEYPSIGTINMELTSYYLDQG
jgi:hypothetical protein